MPSRSGSDAGRHVLVAAGTAHFDKLVNADLLQVPHELERIASAFSTLGYERLHDVTDPDRDQLRKLFGKVRKDCAEGDLLVAYYTGHGARDEERFYLLTRDSDLSDLDATALSAEDLARALTKGSKASQVMLILDACYAGGGAAEFAQIASRLTVALGGGGPGIFVVAAARSKQEAEQGALSSALAQALANRDERLGGRAQPFLAIDEVMGAIDDYLHEKHPAQAATWSSVNVQGRCRLFRNPLHRPEIRPGLDLETQRAFDEHWVPKARGAELAAGGWYFTGRAQVQRELAAWLRQASSGGQARVVTGGPGCGKSAVLARVVTLSDLKYRQEVLAAAGPTSLDPATLPPEGVVRVAVHARRKLLPEVVAQIASALNLSAPTPDELVEALACRPDKTVIVLDALDEADDEEQIVSRLLRPVAVLPQTFLLIGTRPDSSEYGRRFRALGESAIEIDLDNPRYIGADDVARYVERRLLATEEPGRATPYRESPEIAHTVALALSERAKNVFLVAHTAVLALLAKPSMVDVNDPDWIDRLPTGLDDAFAQFLRELDTRRPGDLSSATVRAVLLPLAFAEGEGLPWPKVWAAVATAISGLLVNDDHIALVRKHAAAFIVEAVENDRSAYRLYHEKVAEHLRGSVDARQAQRRTVDALRARVPPATAAQERDWKRAHPYTLTHLAAHALKAGLIGELLTNGMFIAAAEPLRMLQVLSKSTDPFARRAQASYALAFLNLRDQPFEDRLSYLELAARQLGDAALAEAWTRGSASRQWSVPWARWNAPAAHRLLARLSGFVKVEALAIDGVPVVLTSSGKGVHLIDLQTSEMRELRAGTGPHDMGGSLAVAFQAQRPVAAVCRGDHIEVWDLRSRDAIVELAAEGEKYMRTVHVHPGERMMVLAGGGLGKIYVWDLEQGTAPIQTIDAHSQEVTTVLATRLGGVDIVASGSKDGTVLMWDIAAARPIAPRCKHGERWVFSLARARRGGRDVILAGYFGGDIIAWDPVTGERVGKTIESERKADFAIYEIVSCEIDGRPAIVTAESDGAVRVRDLESGAMLREPIRGHEPHTSAWTVSVVRDGPRTLAISGGSDGTVRAWDLDAAPTTASDGLATTTYGALSVVKRRGKPIVLCVPQGSLDETVHVLDPATGARIEHAFPLYETWFYNSAAVTKIRGKTVVAFGSYQLGEVSAFNVATGKPAGRLHKRCYGGTRVAFSELNRRTVLAVADEFPAIHLFDFTSGHVIWRMEHPHGTRAISAIGDGTHDGRPVIVSSGYDGMIRVWDLATRAPVTAIDKGEPWVEALALAPIAGRSRLIFGTHDGSVHFVDIDARTKNVIHIGAQVKSIAITSDAGVIVATSRGLLRIQLRT